MSKILLFKPKVALDAKENLIQFIELCKNDLTVFGENLKWDDWRWPKAAVFAKLGSNSRTTDDKDKLDDDFIDFAKAYFRYQQGQKPTGTKNELKALKALEIALKQANRNAKIDNLSITVLDESAQIIRNHYSKQAAYHGGRELEVLAKFVSDKKLIPIDVSTWKSPNKRANDRVQTGSKAKKRREKKLPSEESLDALAEIFSNNPQDPKDIFTSSTFAMTMCAPERISEIFLMPADCEVYETDNKNIERYGWRFYAGKDYGYEIKWIPTEMVSIAKEAVSRVKKLTEPARKLAKHIENNSEKFYRHSYCPEVEDDTLLTKKQVAEAIDGQRKSREAIQNSHTNLKLTYKDEVHTLTSLWQVLMKRQPESHPHISKKVKIKYSEALFCMTKNQLHSVKATSPNILWVPTNNIFNNDLSPRKTLKTNHESIFDRYGYKSKDGERIKLTSHQARHLLNTIAQRGGLSQLQIAKWSSRADIKQNRTYNHMSEYEMIAKVEELDTSLALFGPTGDVNVHIPITIQEFNTFEKGAVHQTEYGVCVHDFIMSPCDKARDCLNCNEQVCVKGEHEKLNRIKTRFEEVKLHYLEAKTAMEEEIAGADRWFEYHENTMNHLQQLILIMEDDSIPNGARIKLKNNKAFSPLNRVIESKLQSSTNDEAKMLLDMQILLG